MESETTSDDAPENAAGEFGTLGIPMADSASKQMLERLQREQAVGSAHSMEITRGIKEAARRQAEREAETRGATIETRDELRRLNAKTDDLAVRQERTDRWLIFLGAATAVLTMIVVVLTVALLVDALSG
jgi:hypothetical protein